MITKHTWKLDVKTLCVCVTYHGNSGSTIHVTDVVSFQMTYSLTRFGIYESAKQAIDKPGVVMPFYQKVLIGGFAGCIGGFVGTPADMVNVR